MSHKIAYQLRPNKAVDREVFIDLLTFLKPAYDIASCRYISLGGPFLEDFRLVYKRVGVSDLVCLDLDKHVHLRQIYNKPAPGVVPIHLSFEDYVEETNLEDKPSIIWLDFTDPGDRRAQLDLLRKLVQGTLPGSILKITLNAHAAGLCEASQLPAGQRAQVNAVRLRKLSAQLGDYLPAKVAAKSMSSQKLPGALCRVINLVASKAVSDGPNDVLGINSFTYADGQTMVTATLLILDTGSTKKVTQDTKIRNWEFFRNEWWQPEPIRVPVLSHRERLALERCHGDPHYALELALVRGFLPTEDGSHDPTDDFFRYQRVSPHFGRILA